MLAGRGAVLVDVYPAEGGVRDPATGRWRLVVPHSTIPGAAWFPEAGRGRLDPAIERWLLDGITRLARAKPGVGVLLLDIDRFKQINDGHGHAAGDEVLVAVAERITRAIRADDAVATGRRAAVRGRGAAVRGRRSVVGVRASGPELPLADRLDDLLAALAEDVAALAAGRDGDERHDGEGETDAEEQAEDDGDHG